MTQPIVTLGTGLAGDTLALQLRRLDTPTRSACRCMATAPAMKAIAFELRGDFITLDHLLKATGLAGSGGAAKAMVAAGQVQVDGRDELRKTCKLRAGKVVSVAGARVKVVGPPTAL